MNASAVENVGQSVRNVQSQEHFHRKKKAILPNKNAQFLTNSVQYGKMKKGILTYKTKTGKMQHLSRSDNFDLCLEIQALRFLSMLSSLILIKFSKEEEYSG